MTARNMSELSGPLAGLRQIMGTLEAVSARGGRRESKVEAAICQLQFAIDLLDEANSIET
jgi:hypothetical protein